MKWILFAVTLPWSLLVSWPVVLLLSTFAARDLRFERYGILTAVWRDWVIRERGSKPPLWPYSTTLGRAIIYQPRARRRRPSHPPTDTELHEMVHVRQVEDRMMLSLMVASCTTSFLCFALEDPKSAALVGFVLWASGGAWQLPNFLSSVIRHGLNSEGLYFSTEHERSARAQTEPWVHCISDLTDRRTWTDYDRAKAHKGRHI